MAEIQGTQTEKNILTAFAGESQARNRYTYYSSIARKEGYRQIADAFEETAGHEKEHAKRLFKLLKGGEVKIEASFPAGKLGSTLANLKDSAGGENHEHTSMYPEFAKVAREEGLEKIAQVFEAIATAEVYHEMRFNAFIENIENETVFKKSESVTWRCINCGFNHTDVEAPKVCLACNHPQAHFEVLATNW